MNNIFAQHDLLLACGTYVVTKISSLGRRVKSVEFRSGATEVEIKFRK